MPNLQWPQENSYKKKWLVTYKPSNSSLESKAVFAYEYDQRYIPYRRGQDAEWPMLVQNRPGFDYGRYKWTFYPDHKMIQDGLPKELFSDSRLDKSNCSTRSRWFTQHAGKHGIFYQSFRTNLNLICWETAKELSLQKCLNKGCQKKLPPKLQEGWLKEGVHPLVPLVRAKPKSKQKHKDSQCSVM